MEKEITPSMLQRITAEYYATPEKHYSIEVSLDGTILFSTPEKEGQWIIDAERARYIIGDWGSTFIFDYEDIEIWGVPLSDSYRWRMCFYTQEGLAGVIQGNAQEIENGFRDFEKFLGRMENLTGEDFGVYPQEKKERWEEGERELEFLRKKTEVGKYSQTDDTVFRFSQKIINRAAEKAGAAENSLISPLSIQAAFCMLAYASQGKSQEELLNWMEADLGQVQEIGRSITNIVSDNAVSMANAIYADAATKKYVNQNFVKQVRAIVPADVISFKADAARMINDWAGRKTRGMIRELFPPRKHVDNLALLNVVAFEAFWATPYKDIYNGTFFSADGSRKTACYLCGKEHYIIYNESVIGFLKSYEDCDFQYMALLPRQTNDPVEWLRSLSDGELGEYIRSAVPMDITVKMPEFTCEDTLDLKEMLKEEGVRSIFDAKTADLSGLVSIPELVVSEINHKTHLMLDRKGTRAYAATKIGVAVAGRPKAPYFEVKFDRPFVFGIVHEKTGLPLFLGIVNTIEK